MQALGHFGRGDVGDRIFDVQVRVFLFPGTAGALQLPNAGSPTGTEDATSDTHVRYGAMYGSTPRTGTLEMPKALLAG